MRIKKVIAILIVFQISILFENAFACSLIKITVNGKTFIGNNEDFSNPDTRIWFESGNGRYYGVAYVGYDNLFPEGAINEAGLVCDGFAVADKPILNTTDKLSIFQLDLKRKIMKECATVDEVLELIKKYNIYFWSHAVWVFIDKSGKYLVIDGDIQTIGNEDYFIQTNFRQSEITDKNLIDCWRFKKADSMLKVRLDTSVEYCTSIMDSISGSGTQYTTVYDPEHCVIYLYYFHNYQNVIKFDLKSELAKGARVLSIPDLFASKKPDIYFQYKKFKETVLSISQVDSQQDSSKAAAVKSEMKKNQYIKYILASSAFEQLHTNNISKAVDIFKLYIEFFPESSDGYDYLGEAYMENKQYQLALENYSKSVELNPQSINGKQRIKVLKKILN